MTLTVDLVVTTRYTGQVDIVAISVGSGNTLNGSEATVAPRELPIHANVGFAPE